MKRSQPRCWWPIRAAASPCSSGYFLALHSAGQFAQARPLRAGPDHRLYAGFSETPCFGIVGGFDRQFLGKYFTTTHIRANLPVQAGFGGAPLLNLNGEVVGIIIAGVGGGAACYAVPIEAAEKIRMDYARYGEPRHGWLGVKAEEQGDKVDGSNVRIAEIGNDTPAALAGLKPGDILLQIGSVKITEPEDIIDASFFLTAGDKVAVEIVRDGQKKTIEVESARHPPPESPLPERTRGTGADVYLQ